MDVNPIRHSGCWVLTKNPFNPKTIYPNSTQPFPLKKKKRKKKKEKETQHTLNYAPSYTLYHKLFECTLCILNYYTYNTLHLGVTFVIIFNRMLLHMTSKCNMLKCNKLKRPKHPTSKSIKTKPNFFSHLSPPLLCVQPHPQI